MGSSIPAGIGCRQRGYSTAPSPFAMDADTLRDPGCLLADLFADYPDKPSQEPFYRPPHAEIWQSRGRDKNHRSFAAFVDTAASKLRMLAAFAPAQEGARCAS
jgi:hypothetical protein